MRSICNSNGWRRGRPRVGLVSTLAQFDSRNPSRRPSVCETVARWAQTTMLRRGFAVVDSISRSASPSLRATAGTVAIMLVVNACASGSTGTAPFTGNAQVWPPEAGRGPCAVSKQIDVPAHMRDGVICAPTSTVRALPTRAGDPDAHPVRQEQRTGAASRYQTPDWFASHCYLVVVQDIRGQGLSDGTFTEFDHDQDDGYDTVEWAAALPGSNGKVGMYGSSYVGATQWLAA